jgi:uncharacterized OsmC-like protein
MLNKSEVLIKLIEKCDVKTTKDVQEMLKDLFAGINLHIVITS